MSLANIGPDYVLRALGYSGADELTCAVAARAAGQITREARTRSVWRLLPLLREGERLFIGGGELEGRDILRHLEGCSECAALCVTLGVGVDAAIRAAEAQSISYASALDCAASALCEAECAELESAVRERLSRYGKYTTPRFSPGYGDWPIEANTALAELLDAPRAAGISAAPSGALLPRKSVIALCGVAYMPVEGALAGCESCKLKDKCDKAIGGRLCGR